VENTTQQSIKAVVLLSGGLDSTVALAEAIALHHDGRHPHVMAVSFSYGQKHTRELEHADLIAAYYGIKHRIVDLPQIFAGTDSVLVAENEKPMPEMSYAEIEDTFGVSPTYVPYRNGNLLSMATTIAMVEGGSFPGDTTELWAGMHAEDAHNWAYPDCTPEFLGAMANAIYVGTYFQVRLVTPHMWRTKAEVVQRGLDLIAPLDLTMSCYEGTVPACGTCPTCVGRINAFRAIGEIDPILYSISIDWT
jgi:7-cyano-7-deazaguanine synthase